MSALPPYRRRRHPRGGHAERAFTYVVQSERGGPIKIGSAVDVGARIYALQCAHAYKLVLLGVLGDGRLELPLHRRFAGLRLNGEWFEPDGALLGWLNERGIYPKVGEEAFGLSVPEDAGAVDLGHATTLPPLPRLLPTTPEPKVRLSDEDPATPRQAAALEFIRGRIRDTGVAPRLKDIAQHLGLRTAHRLVQALYRKGHLLRGPGGKTRNILLPDVCRTCGCATRHEEAA